MRGLAQLPALVESLLQTLGFEPGAMNAVRIVPSTLKTPAMFGGHLQQTGCALTSGPTSVFDVQPMALGGSWSTQGGR